MSPPTQLRTLSCGIPLRSNSATQPSLSANPLTDESYGKLSVAWWLVMPRAIAEIRSDVAVEPGEDLRLPLEAGASGQGHGRQKHAKRRSSVTRGASVTPEAGITARFRRISPSHGLHTLRGA